VAQHQPLLADHKHLCCWLRHAPAALPPVAHCSPAAACAAASGSLGSALWCQALSPAAATSCMTARCDHSSVPTAAYVPQQAAGQRAMVGCASYQTLRRHHHGCMHLGQPCCTCLAVPAWMDACLQTGGQAQAGHLMGPSVCEGCSNSHAAPWCQHPGASALVPVPGRHMTGAGAYAGVLAPVVPVAARCCMTR
jgi:hypothetical protein